MASQTTSPSTIKPLLSLVKQMAGEMRSMQKALYSAPLSERRALIESMEQYAIMLSRIASRLEEEAQSVHL
jgi:hypothetical protein